MITLVDVLAGLGMSFGLSAITVLSVRSESNLKMTVLTFLWTWIALIGIFAWGDLPDDLANQIAGVGVFLGFFCTAILLVAIRFEKRAARKAMSRDRVSRPNRTLSSSERR